MRKVWKGLASMGRKRAIAGVLALGLGAVGVVVPPEVLTAVAGAIELAVESGDGA